MLSHAREQSSPDPLIIDWESCVQKMSGNAHLAQQLMKEFVAELHHHHQGFMQHIERKDTAQIHAAAHKLHGACCFLAVPILKTKAKSLEQLTQQACDWHTVADTVAQLLESISLVINEYTLFSEVFKS